MSTYAELLAQKKALDEKIDQARIAESKDALTTIRTLIQEFGFTSQQVFPWTPPKKKVQAKYHDPESGLSWTGRGKPPKWIVGKDREQFLIKPNS